jgi:hypothetical protein
MLLKHHGQKENKNFLDRISLERRFEELASRDNNSSDTNSIGSGMKGEITGKKLDNDCTDRGMPMRSQYEIKKSSFDENKYLDFNLHIMRQHNKNKNIKYNDNDDGYKSYAEVGKDEISITTQASPIFAVSSGIEKSGSLMFKSIMNNVQDKNFIVNSLGIYLLFSIFYLGSENATFHELEKFFGFTKKKILLKCIQQFVELISESKIINMKNLIIIDKNIPLNFKFCEMVDNIVSFTTINTSDQMKEAQKLNFFVNKIMGTTMRNPITSQNLTNLQIMLMTVVNITPIWNIKFEKVASGIFSSYKNDRKENYMIAYNQASLYYEDADKQIIELSCDNINFGIILHKKIQSFESNESIHNCIRKSKKILLEEIVIPMFTQDHKIRYNNILKNNGINSIFVQLTADDLLPSSGQIHDVVQNIKITINNVSSNKKQQNAFERSNRKFIADKPFMYYFRFDNINTIIINGMFV